MEGRVLGGLWGRDSALHPGIGQQGHRLPWKGQDPEGETGKESDEVSAAGNWRKSESHQKGLGGPSLVRALGSTKKMSEKLPGGSQLRGPAGRARLSAGVAGPVKGVRQEPVADPGVQVRGDPDAPGHAESLCYPLQAPSISQVEISLVLESEAGSN